VRGTHPTLAEDLLGHPIAGGFGYVGVVGAGAGLDRGAGVEGYDKGPGVRVSSIRGGLDDLIGLS
jgi:hypothetical protein